MSGENFVKALTILVFGIVYFAIVGMIAGDGYSVPDYSMTGTNTTNYAALAGYSFMTTAPVLAGGDNWFTNTISAVVGVMMLWAGLNIVLNIVEIGKNWI